MAHYTLISPRLTFQKGDFLGSGVPYWPVELAVLAGFLRDRGHGLSVHDLFGADPMSIEDKGDHYLQGTPLSLPDGHQTDAFVLYAVSYMSHAELVAVTAKVRRQFPDRPILILENSQAVTAYAIPQQRDAFFAAGATGLLVGEPYSNWDAIEAYVLAKAGEKPPSNIETPDTRATRLTPKGERYAVPAWELFPYQNYWKLPYSHGPKTRRYLPVLTSRGCPWPCDFCVVPTTNAKVWRGRAPEDVVDEMLALKARLNVSDFQIEDLNPTVQSGRWKRICELLVERRADVRLYLVSGTKAETLIPEDMALYARAGLRYFSVSPESGSPRVMKQIGKKFDYEHGLKLVKAARRHGVATQCCFLVGHPAEKEEDFAQSEIYLKKLIEAGADEVAIFIVSPFPGSRLEQTERLTVQGSNLVSFTPKGRSDYEEIERRRKHLIRVFFQEKLKRGTDLWWQGIRSVTGFPRTKMENLPRRAFFIWWLVARHRTRCFLQKENVAGWRSPGTLPR